MKINELLNKRPTLSFEIFPPKNNENDITSYRFRIYLQVYP